MRSLKMNSEKANYKRGNFNNEKMNRVVRKKTGELPDAKSDR